MDRGIIIEGKSYSLSELLQNFSRRIYELQVAVEGIDSTLERHEMMISRISDFQRSQSPNTAYAVDCDTDSVKSEP